MGLRPRLVLLVLLPAVLIAGAAAAMAVERRDRAATASEVRAGVAGLGHLVDLRTSLLFARAAAEVEVRAGVLGLDPDEAAALLTLDLDPAANLASAEAALRTMGAADRPFPVEDLVELEQQLAADPDQAVLDRFTEAERRIDATFERELVRLDGLVVELGDIDLARSLDDLEHASAVGTATSTLLTDLADYWFSLVAGSDRAEAARARLGVEEARFDQAIARLSTSDDPRVVEAAFALGSQRSRGPFGEAIDDGVAGRTAAPVEDGIDLPVVIDTFTDSFEQLQPSLDLVNGRSAQLEARAATLSGEATRTASVTAAVGGVSVLLLIASSIVVAASFARPLQRLIDTARQVGRGELDVDPVPEEGPAEVAAAAAAFNDATETLRLLRDKVDALADADLSDPRLGVPLPGDVGGALASSVEELAWSVADRAERGRVAETRATENARRYAEQRAESLLLQQSLLPGELPALEGLELAVRYEAGAIGTQVGGDWYEVLILPDRIVVVLGDVSGSGLEAAAVMATVRFTVRTLAAQGFAPDRVLTEANSILALGEPLGHFATTVCASIDRSTGTVTVADAGHPRPLLVGADGGAEWIPAPIGPPLAAWPRATYEAISAPIGDATLLLVTDGLFERRDETIDDGLDRLRAAAATTVVGPLEPACSALLQELTGGTPDDDTAILALRWSPTGCPAGPVEDLSRT